MSFYFSVALKHLKLSLVTLLGLGFFPLAPGTWGSLGALALFILLEFFFTPTFLSLVFLTLLLVSFPLSSFGAHHFAESDPAPVVIDELVGLWLVFLPPLFIFNRLSPLAYALGFLFFRFFDALKPPPIHHTQRLPGALGIVADDLAAGLISAILLTIVKYHLW